MQKPFILSWSLFAILSLVAACGTSDKQVTKSQPLITKSKSHSKIATLEARLRTGGLSVSEQIHVHTQLAQLWMKDDVNNRDKATKHELRVVALWSQHAQSIEGEAFYKKARLGVGQVLFAQSEHARHDYERLQIDAMETKDLSGQVKEKVKALQQSENRYFQTIKHCRADQRMAHLVVASIVRIGQLYEHMGKSLTQVPPPPKLTPEQQAVFADHLVRMSVPVVQKATVSYERAIKHKANDPQSAKWKTLAREKLCTIEPSRCQP